MKKIYHIVISVITVAICAVYLYRHRTELDILTNVQSLDVFVLGVIMFLYFFATGYTFKLIVNLLGVNLNGMETIGLSMVTNFGNYLGPTSPGAAMKAVYLKKTKDLGYAKFASAFAVNNFLGFLMMGGIGIALFFLMRGPYPEVPLILLWYSLALTVGATLPMCWRVPDIKSEGKLAQIFRSAAEGFHEMRSQKGKMIFVCSSFFLQFFFRMLLFKMTFDALGVAISIFMALVLAIYTSMFDFYLTPNNLGIQEAIGSFLLTISGLPFAVGMVGLALVRIIHLVVVFALAPVFMHFLLKSANLSSMELKGKTYA